MSQLGAKQSMAAAAPLALSRPDADPLITELEEEQPAPGWWDFLGRVPLPLKHGLRDELDSVLRRHRAETGAAPRCCFLMGAERHSPFDRLRQITRIADFPQMVVSPCYDDFLNPRLFDRFAAAGAFHRWQPPPDLPPQFRELLDPAGCFTPFAIIPWVFLIDHRQLGGLPVPRRWEDLLDPRYADKVVFGGWRENPQMPYQDFAKLVLLHLFQKFGADGLRAFAPNVKHLLNNARVAKIAGSNNPATAGIYILPWLQASICPRRDVTSVVWPEDGAPVMPICFLVKESRAEALAPLIRCLTGPRLGRFLRQSHYPPVGGAVSADLPAGATLSWLGWDYIRSRDMAETTRQAGEIFFSRWNTKPASEAAQ